MKTKNRNTRRSGIGFFVLSPLELDVLLSFSDDTKELLQPESSLAGRGAYKIIRSLKKRGFVTGTRPYRLTEIGIRVKQSLLVKEE